LQLRDESSDYTYCIFVQQIKIKLNFDQEPVRQNK